MNKFITGCTNHYPMVDRNGRQIKVGDKIKYQHCIGRCGQTTINETIVKENHYPYGQIEHAIFDLEFKDNVLRGYHKHDDFEHGHETWVEIA